MVTVALCFVRLSGTENFALSAQRHAGFHLRAAGRRHRPHDLAHSARNASSPRARECSCSCRAFCRRFGAKGIWYALFHSISAFCNAGFDLLGTAGRPVPVGHRLPHRSARLVITIALLILIGGIGFLTWEDIATHRHRIGRYRLQSKIILTVSAVLIAFRHAVFLLF